MSTATIIILFAIALAAIGLFVFVQSRERARIERARQLAAAEDAFRHNARFLEELPAGYLSPGLRKTILTQLELTAARLKPLNSRLDVDSRLAELQLAHEAAGEASPSGVTINSQDTARHIKSLLESLFRLIEKRHKSGKIPAAEAREQLKQILYLGVLTQAKLHVSLARQEAAQGNFRKAIHQYRQAATEMGKAREHSDASRFIDVCRGQIAELEQQDAAGSNSGKKPEPASAADKSRLDEEMEELIHEEEAWKKRSDFDS